MLIRGFRTGRTHGSLQPNRSLLRNQTLILTLLHGTGRSSPLQVVRYSDRPQSRIILTKQWVTAFWSRDWARATESADGHNNLITLMQRVEPLKQPPVPPPRPEGFWDHVPLIAGHRRLKDQASASMTVWLDIDRQLKSRPPNVLAFWSVDPATQVLLEKVFAMLQQRLQWEHCRFIPDDPMRCVMASKTGQFEGADFVRDIENSVLGERLSEAEWGRLVESSFGEFIGYLGSKLRGGRES